MKLSLVLVFFLFAQLLEAQVQDKVDFIKGDVYIEPNPEEKEIIGTVQYEFNVLKDVDSVFLDAKNMEFSNVLLDSKKVKFTNSGENLVIKRKFKKGKKHLLFLDYKTTPKQTVYFIENTEWSGSDLGALASTPLSQSNSYQIWTQGQGKYTSHWLPSFDDMTEKVVFDLSISFNKGYQVFANGILIKKKEYNNHTLWKFDMQKSMSSYLLAFAIGDFKKKTIKSKSGIPIELYYEPKDSLKVEPTYRYTKKIFDFLESEIGVTYPWQNYKQIPVQDFLYAGMENTGATIFSNTFVVDSTAFMDKNFVNVNAHELAHQWFGNLVTEQSGEHHWLHEGFATYYAYLAEKEIFGEDYFYWRLLETAQALNNFSGEGNGEALTDPKAGSLTFYEKGAWALVMLKERVGEANFRQGIENHLSKYAYKNVTIRDFMWEMEKASGMKLSDFEESWLQESEFPLEKAKAFLISHNPSIKTYFEIKDGIGDMTTFAEALLTEQWAMLTSDKLKYQLLLDYVNDLSPEFIMKVLNQENLKVRQAIAFALRKVPTIIKKDFESLLKDKSYKTVESALYQLWTDFPERRNLYLDETSKIIGLPDRNVRLLWLTLALATPDYKMDLKPKYYEELSGYTGSEHHFEVRLLAFQYLKSLGAFNDATIKNLIQACDHHVWHFKKSCRKLLKDFLKTEANKERLKGIYPTLSLEQQKYIDKTLGK
ncbi:M1 family metallopeptidase [Flagellimonas onchidii]|uniref:M1 family metallopeptidase n=1 Tax=Flagellimonas onchidii TaxID=2562684 RepID=UPI0010A6861A|nr:M1 family metallopeptidase [Allomuricauda onchidii]